MATDVHSLHSIAKALVADGKGILAADETVGTLTKRFDKLSIPSTPESRREFRELLFTAPGSTGFISGVILYDETIRQRAADGSGFADLLRSRGVIPGIKVDTGAKLLAGFVDETITEGLDGLRDRLIEYHRLGARFAKWRAVIRIGENLPSITCVHSNAHALGRYAALCQEQGLVPIVEPEVLMEGDHTIERCLEVTNDVLHAVFKALHQQKVSLEGILLKPNMVVPGSMCAEQSTPEEIAALTLRCLLDNVPAAVPGIVFLSGGQSDLNATLHLNAINQLSNSTPWKISFSYGRALQDLALATWRGNSEHRKAAQQAFAHRAKCNSAAALGSYDQALENEQSSQATNGALGYEDD